MTFLVLAEREPALQALDAADAWRGDASLTSRQGGKVCAVVHMRGSGPAGDAKLLAAWQRWRDAMPAGVARVSAASNGDVQVRTCDPGAAAKFAVTDAGDRALAYPVGRVEAAAEVMDQSKRSTSGLKISPKAAYCYSDGAIRIIPAYALLDNGSGWQPDAATQRKLQMALLNCMTENP